MAICLHVRRFVGLPRPASTLITEVQVRRHNATYTRLWRAHAPWHLALPICGSLLRHRRLLFLRSPLTQVDSCGLRNKKKTNKIRNFIRIRKKPGSVNSTQEEQLPSASDFAQKSLKGTTAGWATRSPHARQTTPCPEEPRRWTKHPVVKTTPYFWLEAEEPPQRTSTYTSIQPKDELK